MWYRSDRVEDDSKGGKLFCGILLFVFLFLLSRNASPAMLICGLFSTIGMGGVALGIVWVRIWEGVERKNEKALTGRTQKSYIIEAEA